jgi:hypothetical protein
LDLLAVGYTLTHKLHLYNGNTVYLSFTPVNITPAYYEMELETGKAFTHRLPSPVIELHVGNAEAA